MRVVTCATKRRGGFVMLIDHRTYTVRVGTLRKQLALFEKHGQDPEWLKYLEMNAEAGYLIKQESRLMSPASFAPVKR
jgi:hypothetical protein